MTRKLLFGLASAALITVYGCSDMGKPAVSKDEQKSFEHPVKEPPPEASGPPGPPGGGGPPAGARSNGN